MATKICRTLPRVRELKLLREVSDITGVRRTLPRVRELKQKALDRLELTQESHPSQGA